MASAPGDLGAENAPCAIPVRPEPPVACHFRALTEEVLEEGERSFDLEVMRDASARVSPPHRSPLPFLPGKFRGRGFGRRPRNDFEPGAPVGEE
jgi:hypothetical protein